MTHEDLIEIGFKLYGVEEYDPYYKLVYKPPFKFNTTYLAGSLSNGVFLLYDNDIGYSDKSQLNKVVKILGNEIYR